MGLLTEAASEKNPCQKHAKARMRTPFEPFERPPARRDFMGCPRSFPTTSKRRRLPANPSPIACESCASSRGAGDARIIIICAAIPAPIARGLAADLRWIGAGFAR